MVARPHRRRLKELTSDRPVASHPLPDPMPEIHGTGLSGIRALMSNLTYDLEPAFVQKWVSPFYMEVYNPSRHELGLKQSTKNVWSELNDNVIGRLLGTSEWRSRSTGAYFIALRGSSVHQKRVEQLLIASDRVYADRAYCFALAMLNNPSCSECLQEYLFKMMNHPSGNGHESDALGALRHLDRLNDTNLATSMPDTRLKQLNAGATQFNEELECLLRIREFVSGS